MVIVNGREYPLWNQFVDQQEEWECGTLKSEEMGQILETFVTGITLKPNGEDSAFFTIEGEDFSCGFDVKHGGISSDERCKDGITFKGYGDHVFWIEKPTPERPASG